jgi:hypothetical protein
MDRLSGYRYAHVISLGPSCYVSAVFNRLGLRRYSGPFDWMFTTVPMVQSVIESDFVQFLDKQYYSPVVRGTHTEYKHTFYENFLATNFTHYDPVSDEGHAYLERCVERFRRVLGQSDPKMFLFISQIHTHERDGYADKLAGLHKAITSQTDNATIIGVTVAKGDDVGMTEARGVGSSRLFHYTASSFMTGITFQDPSDDVNIDRFVADLVAA